MTPQGTGPKGRQDYGTPVELLNAVKDRFGPLHWDLAATVENSVCVEYLSPHSDSLKMPWPPYNWDCKRDTYAPFQCWLNPPFSNIDPWAAKCAAWVCDERVVPGSRILFLVPASVGSNWWLHHVSGKARVLALSPRLTFVGCKDPFPKDCALCVYERSWPEQPPLVEPWRWQP